MSEHTEDRLRSLRIERTPVATLESVDGLTLTIIRLPAPAPGRAGMMDGHRPSPAQLVTFTDSLEDATWEDAEWQ